MTQVTKPECCTDKMLVFLDMLRESGETNMLGAVPYLCTEFADLSREQGKDVLVYWLTAFQCREPVEVFHGPLVLELGEAKYKAASEEPKSYEPSDAAMVKAKQMMEDLMTEMKDNIIKLMHGQIINQVDDRPIFNAVLYYLAYALEEQ